MNDAANDNAHLQSHSEDALLETRMRRALIQAWRGLDPAHRPTRARDLITLLIFKYACPPSDFAPHDNVRYDLERSADDRLRLFVEAARGLRGSLPRSKHYHVLLQLLQDRLPDGASGEIVSERLIRLEDWLEELSAGSGLLPRRPRKRPPSEREPYIRDMVRDIFGYILRIEGRQPTASFAGQPPRPNSRAGILAEATVAALGHNVTGIKRHIEAVMRDQTWRQADFELWQALPRAAP